MIERAALTIPCFNESRRLNFGELHRLLDTDPATNLWFVDDGSTDDTVARIRAFASQRVERVRLLVLETNQGKAEAVRRGLAAGIEAGFDLVGYVDADLATPVDEILRLLCLLRNGAADVILASRVSLLGREIQRSAARHYLGRIFASAASLALGFPVYDTQCGAKFFRNTAGLSGVLSTPFFSRWAFNVELLGRLFVGSRDASPMSVERVAEEPLICWHDVAGSKLRPVHMIRASIDLARIGLDLRRHRMMEWAAGTPVPLGPASPTGAPRSRDRGPLSGVVRAPAGRQRLASDDRLRPERIAVS